MIDNSYDFEFFLKRECITDTSEVISGLSLYDTLYDFFDECRGIRYGKLSLINEMNKEYTLKDRFNNFNGKVINPWFKRIFVSEFNENFIKLIIIVNPLYRKKEFTQNNIYYYLIKNRKTGELYFENRVLKNKVFDKFYQEIHNMFKIAEFYADAFDLERKDFPIYHQTFYLGNIGTTIEYDTFGNTSAYVRFNDRPCSNEKVLNIKTDILQRIPISIDKLDAISKFAVKKKLKNIK